MKIEIFEPSLCCSSGVCGPEPDRELIELQNVIQALEKAGVKVERYAINQVPLAFTQNPVVKDFIKSAGPAKLPLTLLDGKIIKKESYPSLEELSQHIPMLKEMKTDGKILGMFS